LEHFIHLASRIVNQTKRLVARSKEHLENRLHHVPNKIGRKIAFMMLNAMKIGIDTLTEVQKKYFSSWQEGT